MNVHANRAVTIALSFFALAFSSGSFAGAHESDMSKKLAGTEWLAVTVDGTDAADITNSTIRFKDSGKADGNTGCNRYTADLSFPDGGISLKNIAPTEDKCDMQDMEAEKQFLAAIGKASMLAINYNVMRLYDADGKELVKFRQMATRF